MQGLRRLGVVAGAAVLAAGLFLALRPDGDREREPTASPPAATPRVSTRPPARTTTGARPRTHDVVARISIRLNRGHPPVRRVRAVKGQRVVLHVGADVADEVHVHGYDVRARVAPRRPARLRFRTRLVGRFDVELEERHLPIARLEVRP